MPNETNENHPLSTPHSVERNGVTATLKCFVGKRGAWENKPYQAPQVETDGTDSDIAEDKTLLNSLRWIGKANVKNFLNLPLKRFGQDYVEDSIGADGTPDAGIFSLDRFLNFWKELRSSAMKLSELNEAYQNAVAEYTDYTSNVLMSEIESGDPSRIAAAKAKVASLGGTVKSLKAEFDERKARRSKEAAAETVTAE